MNVEFKRSGEAARCPGDEIRGATLTDGIETLVLTVSKVGQNTFGVLRTADGKQSWAHNSVAAINLLILHARDFVTVAELLEDLGDCDETRIAKAQ